MIIEMQNIQLFYCSEEGISVRHGRWCACQKPVNSPGRPRFRLLVAHPRNSFRSTPSPRRGEALDQLEVFGPVSFELLARMHGNIIGF